MRQIVLGRITEFANDLDGRTLSALGGDLWSADQIDSFLLVQCAENHLELRVRKDAGDREKSWGRADRRSEEQGIDGINRDCRRP